MMRNALGLLWNDTPYRNRYAAGVGTPEEDAWNDLVNKGLATSHGRDDVHDDKGQVCGKSSLTWFAVSVAGLKEIGVEADLARL